MWNEKVKKVKGVNQIQSSWGPRGWGSKFPFHIRGERWRRKIKPAWQRGPRALLRQVPLSCMIDWSTRRMDKLYLMKCFVRRTKNKMLLSRWGSSQSKEREDMNPSSYETSLWAWRRLEGWRTGSIMMVNWGGHFTNQRHAWAWWWGCRSGWKGRVEERGEGSLVQSLHDAHHDDEWIPLIRSGLICCAQWTLFL